MRLRGGIGRGPWHHIAPFCGRGETGGCAYSAASVAYRMNSARRRSGLERRAAARAVRNRHRQPVSCINLYHLSAARSEWRL